MQPRLAGYIVVFRLNRFVVDVCEATTQPTNLLDQTALGVGHLCQYRESSLQRTGSVDFFAHARGIICGLRTRFQQQEGLVIEFRHILCPADLSESSTRALTYAAALARWYEATLTVLYVVPTFDPMPVRSASLEGAVQMVYPASREEVLDEMRRVAGSAGATPLNPTLAAEAGEPVRTIIDQALAVSADLIVMGTHGRSGFERFMIGSVAEKVLRKAPCPVLTVPPQVTAGLPAEVRFKTILCPMDFSPSALQALGFALDLARQADGSVILMHAIEWLAEEEPPAQAQFNVSKYRQHLIDDARQRLHTLVAEEPRTWSAIQEIVTVGRAHREVLRLAADSRPDLIVMGAQGRGGIGLALFGSTTQQVVRAAPCPVLTVRGTRVGRVEESVA